MNIDAKGKNKMTTILGASLSILIYSILFVYTTQQYIIMHEKKKVYLETATKEYFFSESDVFSGSQGLKFAVAFTGHDNEQEYTLSPEIGELIFQTNEWNLDESGQIQVRMKNLTTHICTPEELGLTESKRNKSNNSQFF